MVILAVELCQVCSEVGTDAGKDAAQNKRGQIYFLISLAKK
jgi:hypothetical protein